MNHIIFQIQDDLAVITLNRPEVANGFHIPMCEEILEALELAEKDNSVSFILINAAGKVFSVGGDLVEMKRAVDEDDIASLTRLLNWSILFLIRLNRFLNLLSWRWMEQLLELQPIWPWQLISVSHLTSLNLSRLL